jgi:hypothetical protein
MIIILFTLPVSHLSSCSFLLLLAGRYFQVLLLSSLFFPFSVFIPFSAIYFAIHSFSVPFILRSSNLCIIHSQTNSPSWLTKCDTHFHNTEHARTQTHTHSNIIPIRLGFLTIPTKHASSWSSSTFRTSKNLTTHRLHALLFPFNYFHHVCSRTGSVRQYGVRTPAGQTRSAGR